MSENITYNGWTNYATWRINLEIFGGFDILDFYPDTEPDVHELAELLHRYVIDFINDGMQYPYGSNRNEAPVNQILLSWLEYFASQCNYIEIASHLIEDKT
jgi:hypothetical protein